MELRILIYSPSPQFRAFVCGILADAALADESSCVRQLLERCACGAYHCVISDAADVFAGGLLALSIRNSARLGGSSPRIFVLSPALDEQTVRSLLCSGVNECICLPVDVARLRAKVLRLVEFNRSAV